MTQKHTLHILLPLPILHGAYVYAVPPEMRTKTPLPTGTSVLVPLGQRKIIGIVWHDTGDSPIATDKIKDILHIYDCPPLPPDIIALITYISAYTLCPLGAVLKMALPAPKAISQPKTAVCYTVNPHIPKAKITAKRQLVLDTLHRRPRISRAALVQQTGVSTAIIRAMETAELIYPHSVQQMATTDTTTDKTPPTPLNTDQRTACDAIIEAYGSFQVFALDGVTGSGKTETYFEAIAHTLQHNKQVLVLLPEIALSSQWEQRFYHRFGFKPHIWHSDISAAHRRSIWAGVLYGTVSIVVGARSALHLPFANLGLIVVDEEHDGAYKQHDTVAYNARDMAIVRAKKCACPIVLASATPSLETWAHMVSGRYHSLKLPHRYSGTQVAKFSPIDITTEPLDKDCFITPTLLQHIKNTYADGLQSLLFLNRRGYAPLSLCRGCGYRFRCNTCDSWLVQHKYTNRWHTTLQCHHCAYTIARPDSCPECGAAESIHACGPGVERIYDEVRTHLPDARIFIATADTLATRQHARQFVDDMQNRTIDIVIGTQVIAKGYDFKHLHLVGVIDGDMSLSGADLRAGETTFQLLHQVGGRVGRGDTAGHAFIQTANANHPVLQALMDDSRDTFLNTELQLRKITKQPPFHRLVSIQVSGKNRSLVAQTAKHLVQIAPHTPDIRILGPADPILPLLRGKYRKKILVNAPKNIKIQPILKNWIYGYTQKPPSVRIQIDIDPYSFA